MLTPEEIANTPVDCVGFVVVRVITDYAGRRSVQHGNIYRRRSDADRTAATPYKLRSFETACEKRVDTVKTCFPLSAVLAREAVRWSDHLSTLPETTAAPEMSDEMARAA